MVSEGIIINKNKGELTKLLFEEWHPTLNNELDPENVAPFSNKYAWWICEKGHEWKAIISSRSQGRGCPYCSGRYVDKKDSLAIKNKKIAKEWHPTKNGTKTPFDYLPMSNHKVWWVCKNNHEWRTPIYHRSLGSKCPYCIGKKVTPDNSLALKDPQLSSYWHPQLNGKLTPLEVTCYSNKKVWWICENNHSWRASINNRKRGSGCPICNKSKKAY
ncbi:hypothetical protein SRABI80_03256 [Peribacillus frigoritolerans]|uniref:zinc-ribbon domain-containing protein n=1 Tax=Peribacillus frigoritolerans TaxID=450367 RepID=UPI001D4B6561|nr:zinc-ribbon domain-containing protein [Peribacillus frigoritolerans]CAH0262611.1 hypothetical protein SRABI80_03256 [Peribacillus frigoritolerans]